MPKTNISGDKSSKYGSPSTFILFAGGANDSGSVAVTARQPRQRLEQPSCQPVSLSLESDRGHAPDIAKAITRRLRWALRQVNADRRAARCRRRALRCNEPIHFARACPYD